MDALIRGNGKGWKHVNSLETRCSKLKPTSLLYYQGVWGGGGVGKICGWIHLLGDFLWRLVLLYII